MRVPYPVSTSDLAIDVYESVNPGNNVLLAYILLSIITHGQRGMSPPTASSLGGPFSPLDSEASNGTGPAIAIGGDRSDNGGNRRSEASTVASDPLSLLERAKRWFAALEPAERSRLLTFEDPAWCLLAANMAARLDRRSYAGQDVRFEVQPPPVGGIGSGRCVLYFICK